MLPWTLLVLAAPAWRVQTDGELRGELRAACEAGLADGEPVLMEFTAAWCGDCRWVQAAETDPAVQAEMAQWHRVIVDVGRFERHTELLKHFGGNAITWFVASHPKDCALPVEQWPVGFSGAFEASALKGAAKPADLVQVLTSARSKL
jgi:hypothetical protein